jgi:alpha-beta hydrolase superfamily lysophospholipase
VVVIAVVGYRAINGSGSSPGRAPLHTSYGATELAVQFTGGGGEQISGSLVLPDKRAPRAPVVLIVPDAEATDRDGYHSADGVADLLYKDLAQSLAAKGIASLRYDSRGHGQSVLLKATTVRLEDMIADARAGVAFLAARSDINPHEVAMLGHAAGGLVTLSAAGHNPSVSAVVLVSTPGRPAVEGMVAQLEATAPTPADGDAAAAQLRSIATGLAAGTPIPATAALATPLRPVLTSDRNAYFKSLFAVDPVALAGGVHVPALVVRGATDPAVTADDSQHLITAMGPTAEEFVGTTDDHTLRLPKPGVGATPADEMAAMHSGVLFEPPPRDDAALTSVASWLAGKLGST